MRALLAATLLAAACSDSSSSTVTPDATPSADGSGGNNAMSFFITSVGKDGANLGGLAGADAHCTMLATSAGVTGREWHAYLSTTGGVNARDRIGTGPWINAKGVLIATNLAELHGSNHLDGTTAVTEKGDHVNGRNDSPNQHDILTGSTADGMAYPAGADHTCGDWTSNTTGAARVGHHDRQGGGADPTSWNSAHDSNGCSPANLVSTGGNGYFYCFAK